MRISTACSVRKRFCSFSFAEHFSLEFYRIQLIIVVGDDGDGFCPPGHQRVLRLLSIVGALPNSVCESFAL